MKNKVTKSFALDEIAIDVIKDIKKHLDAKSDSEVVTFALFKTFKDLGSFSREDIEYEIARRKYFDVQNKKHHTGKYYKSDSNK